MGSRTARLVVGANEQPLNLEGENLTIGEMIRRYGTQMNVPTDDRQIHVNGQPKRENYVVQPGDQVEIMREAGQMG